MSEKKTEYKGMPKLLEGVINTLIKCCNDSNISDEKLISNSKLVEKNHRGLRQEFLTIGGCAFGCKKELYDKNLAAIKNDAEKYRSRKDDANVNSQWIANGITYYTWNELAYENEFEKFIEEFNRLYLDKYKINCINPNEKNKSFSLSEFTKDEKENKEGFSQVTSKESVMQQILFGAPGTGKSFKIDDPEKGYGLKDVDESRKFRTTFHPDYDYAQFVGAYKPKKEGDAITYSFVPQVFAKAYATAWKLYLEGGSRDSKDIQVFLVIEEINRGNCAQIFGDIFQLLDRDEKGFSQYSIDADYDFADWLKTNEEYGLKKDWELYVKFHYEKDGKTINPVSDTKIALPPNLNILATMNTSDQSLFPMDSAFKRRFDWEYVPINYEKSEADFIVSDTGFNFKWLEFLKKVNADIYKVTQSEDKQMGEFFIKPKNKDYITLDEFRSKVLFYLWDSVYKDELDSKLVFHFAYPEKGPDVTFQRLFNSDFVEILKKMLANLDDKYKDGAQQE